MRYNSTHHFSSFSYYGWKCVILLKYIEFYSHRLLPLLLVPSPYHFSCFSCFFILLLFLRKKKKKEKNGKITEKERIPLEKIMKANSIILLLLCTSIYSHKLYIMNFLKRGWSRGRKGRQTKCKRKKRRWNNYAKAFPFTLLLPSHIRAIANNMKWNVVKW